MTNSVYRYIETAETLHCEHIVYWLSKEYPACILLKFILDLAFHFFVHSFTDVNGGWEYYINVLLRPLSSQFILEPTSNLIYLNRPVRYVTLRYI
jgi:hypothetical protein